ncbi:unnamed protein product [Phytomonas sp. Hart1]|nr:unnamed protein product [Phytomonas sp. Hart1]|eukprot:CCW66430.1 unnamed protein product [Phytomonas sp. isolate Hart1]
MVRVCGPVSEGTVWVVSSRVVEDRYRIQISLLDTRSGEVAWTLRAPSRTAELTQVKNISMDASRSYLLVVFWNCTFEVWNTETRRLIRAHAEFGVGDVSWAPARMRGCLDDLQGAPQLLLVIFVEGTLSLWSVYHDRVVDDGPANAVFNLPPAGINRTVQSLAVGSRMLLFNSKGSGFVLYSNGGTLAKFSLKDVPPNLGPVRGLSAASLDVDPMNPSVLTPNKSSKEDQDEGKEEEEPFLSLAAVVFDDHSFGVWDTATGERVGYSVNLSSGVLISAISICWIGRENIAVLGVDGAIYILHYTLRTVNSKFSSRALRRPLENMAFLPSSHRIYLQSSIELASMVDLSNSLSTLRTTAEKWELFSSAALSSPLLRAHAEDKTQPLASSMILNIPPEYRPYRGPFGQIIGPAISSLDEELRLYQQTMVPSYLQRNILHAYGKRRWVDFFYWSARLFGQVEKQRFWLQARLLATPVKGRGPIRRRAASGPPSPLSPDAEVGFLKETTSLYRPYFLADDLTPYLSDSRVLRWNHLARVEARRRAFEGRKGGAEDVSGVLSLAQEFLALHQPAKAVDVLLNGHREGANFNELSTLALSIAAVSPAGGMGESGARAPWPSPQTTQKSDPTTSFFYISVKRAAAIHLARGEVEAAVEKYLLAGDPREASRVLQFQGRWHEAAALIKQFTSDDDDDFHPDDKAEAVRDILGRWGLQCLNVGERMEAARIFLHIRDPKRALEALSGSANYLDIAGALAMALWLEYGFSETMEATPQSDKMAPKDAENTEGWSFFGLDGAIVEAMIMALADYSSLLSSVGNVSGEGLILKKLAFLKMSKKGSPNEMS